MRSRFGYLHVPKTAGSAVTQALRTAADGLAVCPAGMDRTLFGGFDAFDRIEPAVRAQVHLGSPADLAPYDVVIGHFGLTTLLGWCAPDEVAVLLREPRSRLLSLYTFWRGWRPERHDTWAPYESSRRAAELDWPAFLSDPTVASQTDNLVLRMLIGSDPRIPVDGFIASHHLGPLAAEAAAQLDRLGFVDVIDRGAQCWERLGRWLDTELVVTETNRTVDQSGLSADWDRWLAAGFGALTARTAGDRAIWSHAAGFHADDAAVDRLADETLERQVVRVRELAGAPLATEATAPLEGAPTRRAGVAGLDRIRRFLRR